MGSAQVDLVGALVCFFYFKFKFLLLSVLLSVHAVATSERGSLFSFLAELEPLNCAVTECSCLVVYIIRRGRCPLKLSKKSFKMLKYIRHFYFLYISKDYNFCSLSTKQYLFLTNEASRSILLSHLNLENHHCIRKISYGAAVQLVAKYVFYDMDRQNFSHMIDVSFSSTLQEVKNMAASRQWLQNLEILSGGLARMVV